MVPGDERHQQTRDQGEAEGQVALAGRPGISDGQREYSQHDTVAGPIETAGRRRSVNDRHDSRSFFPEIQQLVPQPRQRIVDARGAPPRHLRGAFLEIAPESIRPENDQGDQTRDRKRRDPEADGAPAPLQDEVQEEQGGNELDRGGQAEERAGPAAPPGPIRRPGSRYQREQQQAQLAVEQVLPDWAGQEQQDQNGPEPGLEGDAESASDDADGDRQGREAAHVPEEMGGGIVEGGEGQGQDHGRGRVCVCLHEAATGPDRTAQVERDGFAVGRVNWPTGERIFCRGPFLEEVARRPVEITEVLAPLPSFPADREHGEGEGRVPEPGLRPREPAEPLDRKSVEQVRSSVGSIGQPDPIPGWA